MKEHPKSGSVKYMILLFVFILSGPLVAMDHPPPLKIPANGESGIQSNRSFHSKTRQYKAEKLSTRRPLHIHKVKEIRGPWSWILFILFVIGFVFLVFAIVIGFAASFSPLFLSFSIVAAACFLSGLIMLAIVIANQKPDNPPSLVE